MKQKLEKPSDTERAWIASNLEGAALFVNAFSRSDADQPLGLSSLDRAFGAWLGTNETDANLVNSAINCVGVAFGQFLVIATDEHGSDLAVHGLPGTGDVLIYPANFVAKRWERRESNFLESAYGQIAQQVAALKENHSSRGRAKPWWKFW
jgi:hypothetical protein